MCSLVQLLETNSFAHLSGGDLWLIVQLTCTNENSWCSTKCGFRVDTMGCCQDPTLVNQYPTTDMHVWTITQGYHVWVSAAWCIIPLWDQRHDNAIYKEQLLQQMYQNDWPSMTTCMVSPLLPEGSEKIKHSGIPAFLVLRPNHEEN